MGIIFIDSVIPRLAAMAAIETSLRSGYRVVFLATEPGPDWAELHRRVLNCGLLPYFVPQFDWCTLHEFLPCLPRIVDIVLGRTEPGPFTPADFEFG